MYLQFMIDNFFTAMAYEHCRCRGKGNAEQPSESGYYQVAKKTVMVGQLTSSSHGELHMLELAVVGVYFICG
jgi:hypothetical protein